MNPFGYEKWRILARSALFEPGIAGHETLDALCGESDGHFFIITDDLALDDRTLAKDGVGDLAGLMQLALDEPAFQGERERRLLDQMLALSGPAVHLVAPERRVNQAMIEERWADGCSQRMQETRGVTRAPRALRGGTFLPPGAGPWSLRIRLRRSSIRVRRSSRFRGAASGLATGQRTTYHVAIDQVGRDIAQKARGLAHFVSPYSVRRKVRTRYRLRLARVMPT